MRLTIELQGLKQVQESIKGFSDRRLAAAAATALTRSARTAQKAVQEQLGQRLENPTPYTLGGVAFKPADARTLEAEVFIRTAQASGRGGRPAGVYLRPLVFGGQRRTKAFERLLSRMGVLPSGWSTVVGQGLEVDQFGNIPRATLRTIFRELTRRDAGPQPQPGRARRSTSGRPRIFAVKQGAKGGLSPGIYLQDPNTKEVTSLLFFVPRAVFQQQLPFFQIARDSVAKSLEPEVQRAIAESLQRLNARGRS